MLCGTLICDLASALYGNELIMIERTVQNIQDVVW